MAGIQANAAETTVATPTTMTTPTFRAALAAICLLVLPASAAVVEATYNSPTDVPVTAASYTATGNTVNFTLNHTSDS